MKSTLFFFLYIFSSALGAETALHLYVSDDLRAPKEQVISLAWSNLYKAVFKRYNPNVNFILVTISKSEIENKKKNQPSSYTNQNAISDLIEHHTKNIQKINYLIISTHGNSYQLENDSYTALEHVGLVYESGPNSEFTTTFSSIRGKTSKDLKIVLDSCSTFCGPKKESIKRAKAILDFFNAPDGSIYGATKKQKGVGELSYPSLLIGKKIKQKTLTLGIVNTSAAIFLMASIVAFNQILENPLNFQELWDLTLFSLGSVAAASTTITLLVHPILGYLHQTNFNRGILYSFKNGEFHIASKMLRKRKLVDAFIKGVSPKKICEMSLR